MDRTVRIGIIGTGVGIRTLIPGFRSTERGEVLGIVGTSLGRAEEFAKAAGVPRAYGSFQELCDLKDIDLVCVASPTEFHFEHAMYAVEHGKHVLCEKPLALSMSDVKRLAAASHTTDRICLVDHQLRFNPYIKTIKSLLSAGEIGRPYFIRMHQQSTGFSDRNAAWNWSFEASRGGGVRLAMGSHFVDLLNFWFGKTCYLVNGSVDTVVPSRKYGNREEKIVDASGFFSASLSLGQGLQAQISATAASCGVSRFDVSVYGTEGEIHFDLEHKLQGAFLRERGAVREIAVEGVMPDEQTNKASFFAGTFKYFAPLLVESIMTGRRDSIRGASSFDDAVFTQIVLDAILKSALKGETVEIQKGYTPGAKT